MNKKLVISILTICCLLAITVVLFVFYNGSDNKNGSNMIQRNLYKKEYDEHYNHYEDDLYVDKKCSKIIVTGNTTSGTINLKIVEKDGETDKNTYTYTIEDSINEMIDLTKKHSTDWIVVVDYNEETEGTYTVEAVKKD